MSGELNLVRFKNQKAEYIVEAKKLFLINNKISIKPKIEHINSVLNKREWLVKNVKGMGYKESSHFLRNIGFGEEIAILDRHILKNLKLFGVIKVIPKTLSAKKYSEIEKKMINFSKQIKIPLKHLDLVLWYRDTGEIFK